MCVCQGSPPGRRNARGLRALTVILSLALLVTLFPAAPTTPAASAADEITEALARINQARAAIGVPPLNRHPALDRAASAHANYYRLNFGDPALSGMGLHYEDPGKPGFTGADFAARAKAQGYSGSINENVGISGSMIVSVDWFIATVNHRLTLLDPRYTDIGFGAVNDGAGKAKIEVIDLGTVTYRSVLEPAWTPWPAPDATDIGLRFDGEAPNPFPGATYPVGYPVTLKYHGAGQVAFTAGRITQAGQSVPTFTKVGDGFITRNTFIVSANKPLLPGATYTVTIEGTLDGAPFTRAWNFTTKGEASRVAVPAPPASPTPIPLTPVPPTAVPATPAPPTPTPARPTPTAPPTATPTPTPRAPVVELPPDVAALDPAAAARWQAADYDVYRGAVARTWTWGPEVLDTRQEEYAEAASDARTVYYFDKSRMEINDPAGNRADPWFITNGLLVREMIAGEIQVGNGAFRPAQPAAVTLAGDPADRNPTAATYASLVGVASLAPGANAAPPRTGQAVTATIDATGAIGDEPRLAGTVQYGGHHDGPGHNIADVFERWLVAQPVDWVYAVGYPLTEPYWTRTLINGVDTWVLVQAFERRILTFVPGNAPGWQVEAGNVGFHYFVWRYGEPPRPAVGLAR